MATHSSILAWKISRTEKPSGLQSIGVTKSLTQLSTHTHTGHKRNILSNTAVTNYFQTDFWTVLKMGNRGEVGDKRSNNSFLFFAELLRLPALVF